MPNSRKQKNSCKSFLNIHVYSFDCCIIKYWERYSHCQGKSSCNVQENGLTKFVCNSKSIFLYLCHIIKQRRLIKYFAIHQSYNRRFILFVCRYIRSFLCPVRTPGTGYVKTCWQILLKH